MLIENSGISEAVQFFWTPCRPQFDLKVDFDLQIADGQFKRWLLATRSARSISRRRGKLFRNLLDVSATVEVLEDEVVVHLRWTSGRQRTSSPRNRGRTDADAFGGKRYNLSPPAFLTRPFC